MQSVLANPLWQSISTAPIQSSPAAAVNSFYQSCNVNWMPLKLECTQNCLLLMQSIMALQPMLLPKLCLVLSTLHLTCQCSAQAPCRKLLLSILDSAVNSGCDHPKHIIQWELHCPPLQKALLLSVLAAHSTHPTSAINSLCC